MILMRKAAIFISLICTNGMIAENFVVQGKKKKITTATLRDQYQAELAEQIKLTNRLLKRAATAQERALDKMQKLLEGNTAEGKVQLEGSLKKCCDLNAKLESTCDALEAYQG